MPRPRGCAYCNWTGFQTPFGLGSPPEPCRACGGKGREVRRVAEGKGLGRLPAPDHRDRLYLMRQYAPLPTARYRHYRVGAILDQGASSSCVGHAWRQWLSSAPLMTRTGPGAFDIYHEAQRVDEWPGEDYDGTSVRAGARVLQSLGHVASYLWAFTLDDVLRWVLGGLGCVVLGTDWYEGFDTPDRQGVVRLSGRVRGGHAYLLIGANIDNGMARIANSWGLSYGDKGRAWVPFEYLERLILDNGEACTATEQRTKP